MYLHCFKGAGPRLGKNMNKSFLHACFIMHAQSGTLLGRSSTTCRNIISIYRLFNCLDFFNSLYLVESILFCGWFFL